MAKVSIGGTVQREEIEGKGDSELGEKTGEAELRLTARGTWLPGEARGLL